MVIILLFRYGGRDMVLGKLQGLQKVVFGFFVRGGVLQLYKQWDFLIEFFLIQFVREQNLVLSEFIFNFFLKDSYLVIGKLIWLMWYCSVIFRVKSF